MRLITGIITALIVYASVLITTKDNNLAITAMTIVIWTRNEKEV
jgi:hypothetical protein